MRVRVRVTLPARSSVTPFNAMPASLIYLPAVRDALTPAAPFWGLPSRATTIPLCFNVMYVVSLKMVNGGCCRVAEASLS